VLSVLEQLADEEMLLFKEKINYKLAGSGMDIGHTYPSLYFVALADYLVQAGSPLTSTPTHTRTSRTSNT
jgi:hypothetical protein